MKEIRFRNDVLPLKDKLFRLALRITLNRAEAEDITQDTLIRMWNKRDEWDQMQSLEAYATTICRNLALDRSSQAKNRAQDETDIQDSSFAMVSDPQPDEALQQKQRLSIIRRLMDDLPEVQRSIMLMRETEGMRYDEIAQRLELTETQVKVYLHRARTKLKTTLERIEQYGL